MKIFTFWHNRNKILGYLQLCFRTWKKFIKNHEIILVDFNNLKDYTDIQEKSFWKVLTSKYNYSPIADVIRIDLLNRYGGLWMDMDTIITSTKFEEKYLNCDFKKENDIFGDPVEKWVSNAYIRSNKGSKFVESIYNYQVENLLNLKPNYRNWDYLCNFLINPYTKNNSDEFNIMDIKQCWPEYFIYKDMKNRNIFYKKLYFEQNLFLKDLPETPILMLHNSWTPTVYKKMNINNLIDKKITLVNILKKLLS